MQQLSMLSTVHSPLQLRQLHIICSSKQLECTDIIYNLRNINSNTCYSQNTVFVTQSRHFAIKTYELRTSFESTRF